MSRRRTFPILILLLVAAILLATGIGIARAQASLWISSYVLGGGGGRVTHVGSGYTLDVTAGQPVAGVIAQSPYEMCAGFWCTTQLQHNVYLPLILRKN